MDVNEVIINGEKYIKADQAKAELTVENVTAFLKQIGSYEFLEMAKEVTDTYLEEDYSYACSLAQGQDSTSRHLLGINFALRDM